MDEVLYGCPQFGSSQLQSSGPTFKVSIWRPLWSGGQKFDKVLNQGSAELQNKAKSYGKEDLQKLLNGAPNPEGQWSGWWKFWINCLPASSILLDRWTCHGDSLYSFICMHNFEICDSGRLSEHKFHDVLKVFQRYQTKPKGIWTFLRRKTRKNCWMALQIRKANEVDHESFEWMVFPAPSILLDWQTHHADTLYYIHLYAELWNLQLQIIEWAQIWCCSQGLSEIQNKVQHYMSFIAKKYAQKTVECCSKHGRPMELIIKVLNELPLRLPHFAPWTDTTCGLTLHSFVCITLKHVIAEDKVSKLFLRFSQGTKQSPKLHELSREIRLPKTCWMVLQTRTASASGSWKFWMNCLRTNIHFAQSTDTSCGHTLHSFVCITLKLARQWKKMDWAEGWSSGKLFEVYLEFRNDFSPG